MYQFRTAETDNVSFKQKSYLYKSDGINLSFTFSESHYVSFPPNLLEFLLKYMYLCLNFLKTM
jgi:hypothetical protein